MVYLSTIVTKGGDGGETSLGDGRRVDKDDPRIEAMGAVDELNSVIGLLLAFYVQDKQAVGMMSPLKAIQNDLFDLGADISVPYKENDGKLRVSEGQVARLEKLIEEDNKNIQPIKSFVLPGGTLVAAWCHIARVNTRRAERRVVGVKNKRYHDINPAAVIYLNRLSDLFFVWARMLNDYGKKDILWEPGKNQE